MSPISSDGRRYWLTHSEGFRVDAPGGRVGFVEAVIERQAGEADALIVRAGLLGRRLLVVAADEVEEVAPRRKRVRLRHSPEVGDTEFLADLLHRLPPESATAPARRS
jgi:hypothetical protein